jgi:hypothetical protein
MTHTGRAFLAAMTLLGLGAASPAAQAAFIANMYESGSDVVVSGSGTINTAGFVYPGYDVYGLPPAIVWASSGSILLGAAGTELVDYYSPFTGPASFGSGGPITATSGSGDRLGVRFDAQPGIAVPGDYISGTALASSSLYAGATLASLGVIPGSYTWSWGSGPNVDSFTLNISTTPPEIEAPEPASMALLGAGLVGLALRRRVAK